MYPPGAQPSFAELCAGCGDCQTACPKSIITLSDGGLPALDFNRGECTFCGDCVTACTTQALLPEYLAQWPWRATIQTNCLSLQGISCRACEDACEARAIRFHAMTGGRSVPQLDQSQCIGCGECAFTCPTQAVRFERFEPTAKEIPQ